MQNSKKLENRLTVEEENLFKKEVRIRMIKEDLSYADLSMRLGYSVRTIENAVCQSGTMSKFLASALADTLKINLDDIRREVKNGK